MKPYSNFQWADGLIVAFLLAGLFLMIYREGGRGFESERRVFERRISDLVQGQDERVLTRRFKTLHALTPNYRVGVASVEDHTPVFGGAPYRVYVIGFYDSDRRFCPLVHVICSEDRIQELVRSG